jgi:hypothetical protein
MDIGLHTLTGTAKEREARIRWVRASKRTCESILPLLSLSSSRNFYKQNISRCVNMIVLQAGDLKRRSGTVLWHTTYSNSP